MAIDPRDRPTRRRPARQAPAAKATSRSEARRRFLRSRPSRKLLRPKSRGRRPRRPRRSRRRKRPAKKSTRSRAARPGRPRRDARRRRGRLLPRRPAMPPPRLCRCPISKLCRAISRACSRKAARSPPHFWRRASRARSNRPSATTYRMRWRRSAKSRNIIIPTRNAPSRRRPRSPRQFMALWAATLHRLNGEQARPVAAPEPNDKRFADPGMARQSLLRLSRPGLCDDDALGRRSRQTRRRARPAYARQGAVLPAPARRRPVAVEFHRHQPGIDAHDPRRKRRESGARHAYDGAGHRSRPWQPAHPPDRREQVHARREHGGDARQGRLPQ